jgi:hypothetical protein
MSAKTPFWICGNCGFKNHPRVNQDSTKCEQCGAPSSHDHAVDYDPGRSS